MNLPSICPKSAMDECVNCCTPVQLGNKVVGINLNTVDGGGTPGTTLTISKALNQIYKVSGKKMPIPVKLGNGPDKHLGLCFTCWGIVFELYRLHEKLTALTKANSILNKTFKVIDDTLKTTAVVKHQVRQASVSRSLLNNSLTVTSYNGSQSQSKVAHVVSSRLQGPLQKTLCPPISVNRQRSADVHSGVVLNARVSATGTESQIPATRSSSIAKSLRNSPINVNICKNHEIVTTLPSSEEEMPLEVSRFALDVKAPIEVTEGFGFTPVSETKTEINAGEPLETDCISSQDPLTLTEKVLEPFKRNVMKRSFASIYGAAVQKFRYNGNCSEPNCPQIFKSVSRQEVSKHFREIHERGKEFHFSLQCHLCDKIFLSTGKIHTFRHLKSHAVDRDTLWRDFYRFNARILRTRCGLRLTRDEVTVINTQTFQPITASKPRPKKPSICLQCGRSYKSVETLRTHLRLIHEKISKYCCPVCEKPLQNQQEINRHMISHMSKEERAENEQEISKYTYSSAASQEFMCHECGKIFKKEKSLRSHSKTHLPQESRRNTCSEPNCTYSALTAESLRRHKETVHSSSTYFKFKCSRCSQGFRIGNQLRNHKLSCCDPAERPHKCEKCEKRFKYKQGVEFHYKAIHKMSWQEARAILYPGRPLQPSSSEWRSIKQKKSLRKNKKALVE